MKKIILCVGKECFFVKCYFWVFESFIVCGGVDLGEMVWVELVDG